MTRTRTPDHYPLIAEIIDNLSGLGINSHTDKKALLEKLENSIRHTGKSAREIEHYLSIWAGIDFEQFLLAMKPDHARSQIAGPSELLTDHGASENHLRLNIVNQQVTPTFTAKDETHACNHHLSLEIGQALTPFGRAFLSHSPTGLNSLEFETDNLNYQEWSNRLLLHYPGATLQQNNLRTKETIQQIFYPDAGASHHLTIDLKGSPFQILVWRAVAAIPPGQVLTYGRVAEYLNMPTASRAVGSAIARNAIAYLIPCHRVIPATGDLGQYRWHPTRKKAMYIWEQGLVQGAQQTCPT